MQPMSAAHWFAKCGFSAGLLLLACGVATAWFGNGLQLPSTTTRDGTLITLNRYVREPIPDVVLVGSSLTFRLKEEYFTTPRLRNLGLAGGSPVSGLEIVANQPRLPKVILVETNVLSRSTDAVLVAKYSKTDSARPLSRPTKIGFMHRSIMHRFRAPCTNCSTSRLAISIIESMWTGRWSSGMQTIRRLPFR
jgi:hypothetical protein